MSIDTLIEDIYNFLDTDDYTLEGSSTRKPRPTTDLDGLWASQIGKPCLRQVWYGVNDKEGAEQLLPHTKLKFVYGDILEDVILDLARASGHKVELEQERINFMSVTGRADAVIDGMVIDVKTASKFSFKKFEEGLKHADDSFGYLTQLGLYLVALRDREEVTEKNKAGFLVINKETGNLCLDIHEFSDADIKAVEAFIESRVEALRDAETLPERGFNSVPDGKSGNFKLGVECSYCPYKAKCWPGLRTFIYSNGPRFLTEVKRVPDVYEVKD